MNRNILTAATLTIAVSLTLAGCTAGTEPQSVTQACDAIAQKIEPLNEQVAEAMNEVATDPAAAVSALSDLESSLKDAANNVENEEVKKAVGSLAASFSTVRSLFEESGNNVSAVDITALTSASTTLSAASTDLLELCG
ncbi:hypothetical protein [Lysinibacter sp. HNR]|uniref:hypothetical protein n=1 Tax=Lysinibacter sp. HNR TaxID=3031408 RepID=UPI002434F226|nr:hypothetical protein [Lysinibacter sp. HNR]WGD36842.1 hypothetical protein FrondiHNR_10330 [Lysinibacter sp. HNR]